MVQRSRPAVSAPRHGEDSRHVRGAERCGCCEERPRAAAGRPSVASWTPVRRIGLTPVLSISRIPTPLPRHDASIRLIDGSGTVTEAGTIDGVAHGGEGGLLGLAVSPTSPTTTCSTCTTPPPTDNRIATVMLRRRRADRSDGRSSTGIPKGGIHNGGRMAFGPDGLLYVGHRRRRRPADRAGPGLARREDPAADAGRRAGTGQPVPRLAVRLHLRPPQRAGSGVRRPGPALGVGVRAEHLGRAQPDHGRRQLRLAGGRGHQAPTRRVHRPAAGLADRRGLAQRHRVLAGLDLDGRRCAASGCGRSRSTDSATDPTGEPIAQLTGDYGRLRTVAVAPGRQPVGDHVQHRRPRRRPRRRRPDPAAADRLRISSAASQLGRPVHRGCPQPSGRTGGGRGTAPTVRSMTTRTDRPGRRPGRDLQPRRPARIRQRLGGPAPGWPVAPDTCAGCRGRGLIVAAGLLALAPPGPPTGEPLVAVTRDLPSAPGSQADGPCADRPRRGSPGRGARATRRRPSAASWPARRGAARSSPTSDWRTRSARPGTRPGGGTGPARRSGDRDLLAPGMHVAVVVGHRRRRRDGPRLAGDAVVLVVGTADGRRDQRPPVVLAVPRGRRGPDGRGRAGRDDRPAVHLIRESGSSVSRPAARRCVIRGSRCRGAPAGDATPHGFGCRRET